MRRLARLIPAGLAAFSIAATCACTSVQAINVPTEIPGAAQFSHVPSITRGSEASCKPQSLEPTYLLAPTLGVRIPIEAMPLETRSDGGVSFPVTPINGGQFDPRWSAAWWQDGARPGSCTGTAHLDVHTYADGGAAGNIFGTKLHVGDILHITGVGASEVVSYRITEITTWDIADVPTQDLSRSDGSPRLAIEFCWRTDTSDKNWSQRRYVIADQLQ